MTLRMSMTALYTSLALLAGIATGCQLVGPLDLGRLLSSQTLNIGPSFFRPGELQNLKYHGARISHNTFCSGEHVGTHFDAPYHFYESGWTVEQVPLERLIANGLSSEALNRLAQIDEIVGFGVDTPSIDSPGFGEAHAVLAAKNIYNLEQVNLDQPCLPEKGFKVFTMPMNIAGGTGAPTRIIAIPECPS